MERYPAEPPRKDYGVEERAPGKKGIALAVIGAVLIIIAMLDGWPAG